MNLSLILLEGEGPILGIIEWISIILELVAVAWILIGVFSSTAKYFYRIYKKSPQKLEHYTDYRHALARTLMLGLEILVAADVVRTVALEPTFENVGVLGLLVLIRIILGWSLVVEIEGRWPWQPPHNPEKPEP